MVEEEVFPREFTKIDLLFTNQYIWIYNTCIKVNLFLLEHRALERYVIFIEEHRDFRNYEQLAHTYCRGKVSLQVY